MMKTELHREIIGRFISYFRVASGMFLDDVDLFVGQCSVYLPDGFSVKNLQNSISNYFKHMLKGLINRPVFFCFSRLSGLVQICSLLFYSGLVQDLYAI